MLQGIGDRKWYKAMQVHTQQRFCKVFWVCMYTDTVIAAGFSVEYLPDLIPDWLTPQNSLYSSSHS